MKRKHSIATAIAFCLSATTFISCQKESMIGSSNPTKRQPAFKVVSSDWGVLHNESLIQTESLWADSTSDERDSILLNMVRAMRDSDEDFESITDQDARNMMASTKFQDMLSHAQDEGSDATTYWRSVLGDLLQNGKISQVLHDAFYEVFDASLTNQEVLDAMNAISTTGLSSADIEYLTVARSVMNSSNDYWITWANNNPNTPRARKLSNGEKALIVDTIAAIGFFEAGPFGVFIAAACSSAFTE